MKRSLSLLAAGAILAVAAPTANAAIYDPRPTDQLSLNFTKISYLEVKLPDVLVSSYSISGHA